MPIQQSLTNRTCMSPTRIQLLRTGKSAVRAGSDVDGSYSREPSRQLINTPDVEVNDWEETDAATMNVIRAPR